jgi:transcription elongation factor Elf1
MCSTAIAGKLPLECPSCGSTEVDLTYTAPVHVRVWERNVVSVTVDDEASLFAGSALCGICGRRWRLCEEPETGLWPAWEVGP